MDVTYLSKDNTECLRGVLAVSVVLYHMGQMTQFNNVFTENGGIDVFLSIGIWDVGFL